MLSAMVLYLKIKHNIHWENIRKKKVNVYMFIHLGKTICGIMLAEAIICSTSFNASASTVE